MSILDNLPSWKPGEVKGEMIPKTFRPEKEPKPKKKQEREPIGKRLRTKIIDRDQKTCQMCGITRGDGAKLHVDHKLPVAQGGRTCEANLWTLCEACNLGKGNSTRGVDRLDPPPPKPPDTPEKEAWRKSKSKSLKPELNQVIEKKGL